MPGEAALRGSQLALDAMTGRVAIGARAVFLAALTAAPTDATTMGTMAEVTTAGYARQECAFTAPDTADPPLSVSAALETFGPFTADPPNITHLGLVSAATGTVGDFIFYWALDVAKDAALNETIEIAAGALKMAAE